jgi:hypothetical protein
MNYQNLSIFDEEENIRWIYKISTSSLTFCVNLLYVYLFFIHYAGISFPHLITFYFIVF